MSDILQITTPMLPRNYTPQTGTPQNLQEAFQLADLTHVVSTQERSAQQQQDNADYAGDNSALKGLGLVISQNPSEAADSLRSLLTDEILQSLKDSGNISFLDELTALADEITLTPEILAGDMSAQAEKATIFNGDVFDMLRDIVSQSENIMGGSEIRNAVASLLKAYVGSASSEDVMNSLSGMLKYMSEEMYASRTLSEELSRLSEEFAKPEALFNLEALKSQLAEVMKDANSSLLLTDNLKSMIPLMTYNLSRIQTSPTALLDAFSRLTDVLPQGSELREGLTEAFTKFVEESPYIPEDIKSAVLGKAVTDAAGSAAEKLALGAQKQSMLLDPEVFKDEISLIPTDNGLVAIKELLQKIVPEENEGEIDKLIDKFTEEKDLNRFVGQLSTIITAVKSDEIKLPLAQKLNEALEKILSQGEGEVKYERPTAMEGFTNFLLKNMGESTLKTIASFDRQNLMSALLTAPGVYTPLLHFLVPLQVEDKKAYGEVWIDNEEEGSGGEEDMLHILLDFSIESLGDFELEIDTRRTDMNVNLLCPTEFSKSFSNIRTAISRLATAKGYSVKNSNVGVLKERRTLTQVFPKLKERRNGLNATA